jgi:hypothetical protein
MAVEDIDKAFEMISSARERRGPTSTGSLAALCAPTQVDRLVLDAFVWTGEGSPTLANRREQLDKWRSSHVRQIDNSFMHSIFREISPAPLR